MFVEVAFAPLVALWAVTVTAQVKPSGLPPGGVTRSQKVTDVPPATAPVSAIVAPGAPEASAASASEYPEQPVAASWNVSGTAWPLRSVWRSWSVCPATTYPVCSGGANAGAPT